MMRTMLFCVFAGVPLLSGNYTAWVARCFCDIQAHGCCCKRYHANMGVPSGLPFRFKEAPYSVDTTLRHSGT